MAHQRAGQQAKAQDLHNIARLVSHYYQLEPDPNNAAHLVQFGTSGHRGCADHHSFNQLHILAISQAIVDVRKLHGISGPIFVGKDTHALSEAAFCSVIDVLVANEIEVIVQQGGGYTPTPAISYQILNYNKQHSQQADGIIITPSHNPPQDGGIKYNPPHGGPAQKLFTQQIEQAANCYIATDLVGVRRLGLAKALLSPLLIEQDFVMPYVKDLACVIDMNAIKKAGLHLGVDPLGGAGTAYWQAIKDHYGIDLTIINEKVDPSFSFMTLDKDGLIRMDCSSPMAMAGLLAHKAHYDLAFGNDPDVDRHGIVTPQGLMDPNHFLAVCVDYLFQHRPLWQAHLEVGKTLVSSLLIDKVAARLDLSLQEVPVGFKWFVDGLLAGSLGFAGEESAGATLLRFDATTWTTDKDGIVLCLLAAEILAVTGKTPQQYYEDLITQFGAPCYSRIQAPATRAQKALLSQLSAEQVMATALAGDVICEKLTHAPANAQPIGGLKVSTAFGWFAARPSGTEEVYKIYCESIKGEQHLRLIEQQAQQMISDLFEQGSN